LIYRRRVQRWLFLLAACGGGAPITTAPAPPPQHHRAEPLGHHFDNAEHWAKVFDEPGRDRWQRPDRVVELLALKPGMTVVDLGAGTGYFEKRLSVAVGETGKVLAIDVEPDMVRYLGERAEREGTKNVEARLGDVDDPHVDQVDRILIVDTWHHIPDRVAYAQKLKAALKPGGFVLIVDFSAASKHGPPPEHRLAQDKVIGELAQAGLHASVVATLPDQYVVKATP